jgi:hypothetical protein
MRFIDANQRISLRGLNTVARRAKESSLPSGAGIDVQTSGGNAIYSPSPQLERYCTARITDYCYDGDDPLQDSEGNQLYQWVEENRYIDNDGNPAWQDSTFDGARGSVDNGDGSYTNPAREANNAPGAFVNHVLMFATVNDTSEDGEGFEHVFYASAPRFLFGLTTDEVDSDDDTFTVNTVTSADANGNVYPPNSDDTIIVSNWAGWSAADAGVQCMFILVDMELADESVGHGNFVQGYCT